MNTKVALIHKESIILLIIFTESISCGKYETFPCNMQAISDKSEYTVTVPKFGMYSNAFAIVSNSALTVCLKLGKSQTVVSHSYHFP